MSFIVIWLHFFLQAENGGEAAGINCSGTSGFSLNLTA